MDTAPSAPSARPRKAPKRAPPSSPADPAARRRGRPPQGTDDAPDARVRDLPGITVRAEPDLLARLDAIVADRNRRLRAEGASTSRGAVMALALREFCDRYDAARAEHGTAGGDA